MLPSTLYQQHLHRPGFHADPHQQDVLKVLDDLHLRLVAPPPLFARRRTIPGLFLWGPVGSGKSFLVDLFYSSLPEPGKTRQHYQHFMAGVHRELNTVSGQANPLTLVAKSLASRYRVICLDELYLTDIGDARLIAGLFEGLIAEKVTLLMTSNFAPESLYRDARQPAVFDPAISLIRRHFSVQHLDGQVDYRQLQTGDHKTWFVEGEQDFQALFDEFNTSLNGDDAFETTALDLHGHALQPLRHRGSLVWFSFSELCGKPRSARDFIALGRQFKTFLLSGVPRFGENDVPPDLAQGTEDSEFGEKRVLYSDSENAQRRFMSLVDELYDQGIKLYLEAAVPLAALYAGGKLAFEFRRTVSRLTEMQSAAYRDRSWRA